MEDDSTHLTRQHLLSIKDEYFEQDQWYDALCSVGLEGLTFPSRFVQISSEEADGLLTGSSAGLCSLTEKIEEAQQSLGAKRIFVKFLRSPKDAGSVYDAASHRLSELLASERSCSIWQLFGKARQEALGVTSAVEAVALLKSSGRVCAAQASEWAPEGGDVWWAVHGSRFGEEFSFEQMRPRLMVRTFDHALPLCSEWRAFIWNRKCTGVSQYFYDFAFEELQGADVKGNLLTNLNAFLARLDPVWNAMPHEHAMMDFVWEPESPQPITLIEINPFDPDKGLGHTSSLALFDWAKDGEQLRNGTDCEVRVTPVKCRSKLESDLNRNWPTVGSAARDAMCRALKQLPLEDIETTHFLTQAVARKLGFRFGAPQLTELKGKGAGKGKEQGKGKGKGTSPALPLPSSVVDATPSHPPGYASTSASRSGAARASLLEDVLARRRQATDEHVTTNMDVACTKVREGLWLGNSQDAEDAKTLRCNGITHILNCASDVPNPEHIAEFKYLRLDLDDIEAASGHLLEALQSGKAFDFIEEGVKQGGVLIHCRLGRSRSASILVGFMVARLGCTYDLAMGEVKQKRQLFGGTLVEPNGGFKETLSLFCASHYSEHTTLVVS